MLVVVSQAARSAVSVASVQPWPSAACSNRSQAAIISRVDAPSHASSTSSSRSIPRDPVRLITSRVTGKMSPSFVPS